MSTLWRGLLVFSSSLVTPNTLLERDTEKYHALFMYVKFTSWYNGVAEKPKVSRVINKKQNCMKSFKFLMGLFLIALIVVSCKKNNNEPNDPNDPSNPITDGYTVSFDLNYENGGMYKTIEVKQNGTVTKPENPTRSGFDFYNWYTDKAGTNEFDFSTPIVENITLYAQWAEIFEAVDLGLSSGLKWATCNIGAPKPEDYGNYYAWGECETKTSYYLANYSFYADDKYLKYNDEDKLTSLLPEDDVTALRTKNKWFTPSNEQINELIAGCDLSWETRNDKCGIRFTSKVNGNSIFIPASGYRYENTRDKVDSWVCIWSSTLNNESSAYRLFASQYEDEITCYTINMGREQAMPIRPVCY